MEPLLKRQAAFPALKAPQHRQLISSGRAGVGGGATGVAKNGNALCVSVCACEKFRRGPTSPTHILLLSQTTLRIAPLNGSALFSL